jgi:ACR3 family arsenite efflux pump ArsB
VTREPRGVGERTDQHQIAVHLAAMAAGGLLGWAWPAVGPGLEHAINPVLGALLYVTLLQVPAAELLRSLLDGRFLSATLVVNFLVVASARPAAAGWRRATAGCCPGEAAEDDDVVHARGLWGFLD